MKEFFSTINAVKTEQFKFKHEKIEQNLRWRNLARVQLTKSSRRENGGAYREDVFGGKWMVSKGKMIQIKKGQNCRFSDF